MRRFFAYWLASFSGLSKMVWFLALITLINRAGTMIMPFIALYVTRDLGRSEVAAGLVLSLYGVGSMAGAWTSGRLTDRFGAYRILSGSLIGAAFVMFTIPFLKTLTLLGIGMFAVGLVGEAYRPAMGVAVANAAGPEKRRRAFALIRLAINLGMVLGPSLGGIMAMVNYNLIFLVDGLTCGFAGLLALKLMPKTKVVAKTESDNQSDPEDVGQSPWKDANYLYFLVMVTLSAAMFFQAFSTYPLYLKDQYGLSERAYGLAMGFNGVIIILFEMMITRRFENHRTAVVMAIGTLLAGTGFGILPLGAGYVFVLFSVAIWTLGEILQAPSMLTYAADAAPDARRGAYMGAYNMCYGMAFTFSPITGAWIYATLGGEVLWYGFGLISLLISMGMLRLKPTPSGAITP